MFEAKAKTLIDDLKAVCAKYGLGNDGNEFKIITQVFLYKFLNDKFAYEVKQRYPEVAKAEKWEDALRAFSTDDYELLQIELGETSAFLKPEHFIATLYEKQNTDSFAKRFDDTLIDIAATNSDLFSVKTEDQQNIILFDRLSEFVTSKRDEFCRALVNKLVPFSFEHIFSEKYDFYATIFEYLIQDYNKDSGGKYAEYYTPHAVAKIMANCLVQGEQRNVTCYDPSTGSGTLLMNLAHKIGEQKCSIFSQDISQKSSHLLRLNLILNGLIHSISNIVQGNTCLHPYHTEEGSTALQKFDFIVSNPPFKLDFSDDREELDGKKHKERFFAGVPTVPPKKKDSMAIYELFIQHIIHSLSEKGKAAIVLPTGFLTAQKGIDAKIRKHLVDNKMLAGVVSMPSNIFATTGTNVSILFIDAANKGDVVLIDASKLGTKVKDGKNQKTLLSDTEEDLIIDTFNNKQAIDDLSIVVSYDDIANKNCSLSAGQYFEVKIDYVDISKGEFEGEMQGHKENLQGLFKQSRQLEGEIEKQLKSLSL